jgi:hypothetical protein
MDIQVLSHAGALSPGSQLWLLPTSTAHSRWLSQVDWYLNFQWSRAAHHKPQTLSEEMVRQAKTLGFEIYYNPPEPTDHLMVLSKRLLPNDQTVFVDSTDPVKWLKEGQKVWNDLGKPTVRLFLPKGTPMAKVQTVFAEAMANKSITVVLDRGDV